MKHLQKGISMFKIKYNTGISNRQVTFTEPFKRLDYCNAAYYHKTHVTKPLKKIGHSYTVHTFAFVSYETPICRITRYIDNVTHNDFFNVYVNKDSYKCSNSTIHQLVRFLRIAIGDLFTYQEIKYYETHSPYKDYCYISSYAPIRLKFVNATVLNDAILSDNDGIATYWSAAYVESVARMPM